MEQHESLRAAIRRIAWGYLIILLDINIGGLNILPNWLGLLLMLRALPALSQEEPSAQLLQPLGILLAFWDGICWIGTLFGNTVDWPIPQLLATVLSLYFHFQLLTNLANIASRYGCPQETTLRTLRTVQVVLLTVSYLVINWLESATLILLLAVVSLGVAIIICRTLFSFHRFLSEQPQESA